jgi:hypothetical protein
MNSIQHPVHLSHSLRQAGVQVHGGLSILGTLARTVGRVLPARMQRRRPTGPYAPARDDTPMYSPCL